MISSLRKVNGNNAKVVLLVALVASTLCGHGANLERTNLLTFIDPAGTVVAVRSTNDWLQRRHSIIAAMQEVMGPMPETSRRVPLEIKVEEETDCGEFVRRRITYLSEPHSRVPAYLLVPKSALTGTRRFPGVLALHQTHPLGNKVVAGLGNRPDDEYAVELARRGYVCLAPAYPLLADYNPDLKALGYVSGTMKAIWDNRRGLDLLESFSFVKPGAFAAIGHSLGGHNAIYTAAFDERIKVIVSSCGFDSYRDYKDGNIAGWTSDRYMPRLKNYKLEALPFDFHEIIGALAPRSVFVNAPTGDTNFKWRSVDDVAAGARPIFALYGQPEKLRVEHPECGHQFPSMTRQAAYSFIDHHLK